jgi:hypothetical protein
MPHKDREDRLEYLRNYYASGVGKARAVKRAEVLAKKASQPPKPPKHTREKYKQYQREYQKKNREKLLEQARQYANRPEVKARRKAYIGEYYQDESRKSKRRAYMKQKYHENRDKILAREKARELITGKLNARRRWRYANDIDFKIRMRLRTRLTYAIKKGSKTGSAVTLLGCSIPEFKAHIEKLFQPGMTWENWGEWHLDHIRPLASFDLTQYDELRIACHHTNLQPLWGPDNLTKGDRWEPSEDETPF